MNLIFLDIFIKFMELDLEIQFHFCFIFFFIIKDVMIEN